MTEIDDSEQVVQPSEGGSAPSHNDRIGDILRREREKRQISVDAIAKKLRLNAKYIEALETNHYDRLPGDTYIRVYLRSLSHYLALDSEKLLQRFFDERGLTGADTLRKDSSTKIHLTALNEAKKSNPTLIIALSLIVVLAIVAFFVQKKGWLSSHGAKAGTAAVDMTKTGGAASLGAVSESSAREGTESARQAGAAPVRPADTGKFAAGGAAPGNDTLKPPADIAESLPPLSQQAAATQRPMKLAIAVWNDSCRLRVYCDGKEWQGILPKGKSRVFTARDSFNVFADPIEAVSFAVNGKSFANPARKGAAAIKVDRGGVTPWSLEKWEKTFH